MGDNLPPGANPDVWQRYVTAYAQMPDWAPQGRVIADTGFRPHPDGFSFFNTGKPDAVNNAVFGTPLSGPKNLDANTMRDLMGKRVCVERRATGPCTLTPAARQYMQSTNASMAGGHCFGFASTASELFDRSLRPEQFQPGATRTYDLTLQERVSRQIARNMAAQYSMDLVQDYRLRPTEVVETLKRGLTPGNTPYTLFLLWNGGGHAVTPYALHDRGDGQYDVAIYDNNYPDAERAVRINTRTDKYQYLVSTNPGEPPTIANKVIGLVPVSEIAKKQSCPFCASANKTTVTITPVKSKVPIKTHIRDLDGKRIKGVKVRKPAEPWQPGEPWLFPTYTVPAKQGFVVVIDGRKSRKDLDVNVLSATGSFTIGTSQATVPARGIAATGVDPSTGVVVYTVAKGSKQAADVGRLAFVETLPASSVEVQARTGGASSDFLVGRLRQKQARVELYTESRRAATSRVAAALTFEAGGQAVTVQARTKARVPGNGKLVLDYAKWTAKTPKRLTAYIKVGSRTRSVPVKVMLP
jgi:hypothetical protein